jgi:putative transposase
MPRPPRTCPDFVPEHIINRGNYRSTIFRCAEDYLGFIGALALAGERTVVRLIAFCLMPNHWHLVLWPVRGSEISAYMQIVMNDHIRDLLRRHGTAGAGHIYQSRFKNLPIIGEQHFLKVCRYVEANPRTAGLVERAEDWRWSSLAISGPADEIDILAPWPFRRPTDWLDRVNRPLGVHPLPELKRLARRARKTVAGTFVG